MRTPRGVLHGGVAYDPRERPQRGEHHLRRLHGDDEPEPLLHGLRYHEYEFSRPVHASWTRAGTVLPAQATSAARVGYRGGQLDDEVRRLPL